MGDKILSKYAIKETLGIIILYFTKLSHSPTSYS